MTAKRPSLQFYPDDWLSDPALRRCSSSTRGIWIDLICAMHGGQPYGHLATGGSAFTVAEIARLTGESAARVRAALAELERNGVSSRTEDGVLYCRRMVRDEDVRQRRAAGGELGAEHGILGREHGNRGGRPPANPRPAETEGGFRGGIPNPPPSSSSSSSASARPSGVRDARAPAREAEPVGGAEPGRPVGSPPPRPALRQRRRGPLDDAMARWDERWAETRTQPGADGEPVAAVFAWDVRAEAKLEEALRERAGGDVALLLSKIDALLVRPLDAWQAENASPAVLFAQWNRIGVEAAAPPARARSPGGLTAEPTGIAAAQAFVRECEERAAHA